MKQIDRWIPEARFIHMIRDGRDAALSRFKRILKDPPPTGVVAERWVRKIEGARADGADLEYIEVQYEALVRDTEPELRRIAEFLELPWDDSMLRYYERAEERLAEMHRDLPGAAGRPLRPADHRKEAHLLTSKPPDPSRLARWKQDMAPADIAAFESVAAPLLRELGYEVVSDASSAGPPAPAEPGAADAVTPSPLSRIRRDGDALDEARPPAPFVVGLTRSGTTLLRMMLDAHPLLTIPPETHFLPDLIKAARAERGTEGMLEAITSNRTWGDFGIGEEEMRERLAAVESGDGAGAVRAFFAAYADKQGKPRWGDKTPAYMLAVQRIGRTLPESRFVHLIRDGRDVALSRPRAPSTSSRRRPSRRPAGSSGSASPASRRPR